MNKQEKLTMSSKKVSKTFLEENMQNSKKLIENLVHAQFPQQIMNTLFCMEIYNHQMRKAIQWTDQEDKILIELHSEANCFQKWKFISQKLLEKGIIRNETECRDRFVNRLNPDLRTDRLENEELRLIFKYYDEYGPLWSVFESLIPGRSQNLLKNKFYSALRSGVRLICYAAYEKTQKQDHFTFSSISSKLLVDIYEGKKRFKKFKHLIRKCFKVLDFQPEQDKLIMIEEIFGQENLQKLAEQISSQSKRNLPAQNKLRETKKNSSNLLQKINDNGGTENVRTENEHPQTDQIPVKIQNTLSELQSESPQISWIPQVPNTSNLNQILYYYPIWSFFTNPYGALSR